MKNEKKFLLFYFWGLSFSLLYYVGCANTRSLKDYDNRNPTVSLKKGVLDVQVRTNADEAGQFTIGVAEAGKIKALLYNNPLGPWSHINVLYVDDGDSVVYSNSENIYSDPQNELLTLDKEPSVNSDSTAISCTWKIGNIKVEQRLTPKLRDNKEEVLIQYIISNDGKRDHEVGLLLKMDTMINKNDSIRVGIKNFGILDAEQHFFQSIPNYFRAIELKPGKSWLASEGSLRGGEAISPEKFVVGNWWKIKEVVWEPSLENTAYRLFLDDSTDVYLDSTAYRSSLDDSAVLLRWPVQLLSPGQTLELATYYGLTNAPYYIEKIRSLKEERAIPDGLKDDITRELKERFAGVMRKNWPLMAANDELKTMFKGDTSTVSVAVDDSCSIAVVDTCPGLPDSVQTLPRNYVPPPIRVDFARLITRFYEHKRPIEFFSSGYYKPYLKKNMKDFVHWAYANGKDSSYVNPVISDTSSFGHLKELFEMVAAYIDTAMQELAKDTSDLILTLSFEGTADRTGFKDFIQLTEGNEVPCGSTTLSDKIFNNRHLECLRAFYTKEEFFSSFEKSKTDHYAQLRTRKRLNFESKPFEGVDKLQLPDDEDSLSRHRRAIITLSYDRISELTDK